MKNNKVCPKCSSNKILRIEGTTGVYGVGNNIPAGFLKGTVNVSRYLCCNCGFIEEWVEDKSDIEKLIKEYGNK
ncbi:hypothetical protein [Clostridium tertium]|uniref:Nucleic-acid-binding protein containing Zn-ribbon domain (DUF2082) n=1 Tax=Clostridium tertium TaxID=1559 RepID=A0A6N3DPB6_9CLOT